MRMKIKKDESFNGLVNILSENKFFNEMLRDFIVFGEATYLLSEDGQNICIIYPIN